MVDASADALVVVDTDGVVRLVNAQAEAMFGVPREELVGGTAHELVPGVFHALGTTGAAADTWQSTHLSARAVRRDGCDFPAEISMSPVQSADGMLTCASIRDVSDRHAVREASERIRDELIATMSHELRTPLTSILGYTEILVDMGEQAVSEQAARLLGDRAAQCRARAQAGRGPADPGGPRKRRPSRRPGADRRRPAGA